jgi:hypothetical protein
VDAVGTADWAFMPESAEGSMMSESELTIELVAVAASDLNRVRVLVAMLRAALVAVLA